MLGLAVLGELGRRSIPQALDPRHVIAVREIELLLRHRRGARPVDAREEEAFFRAAAARLLAYAGAEAGIEAALGWAGAMCPRLVAARSLPELGAIARRYAGRPPHRPETLGTLLAVTPAEREGLRLTKIRYAGQDDGRLLVDGRRRDAARKRDARRKAGATPREASASQTKPWLAAGYASRRTWERHGKPLSRAVSQTRPKQDPLRGSSSLKGTEDEFTTRAIGARSMSLDAVLLAAIPVPPGAAGGGRPADPSRCAP